MPNSDADPAPRRRIEHLCVARVTHQLRECRNSNAGVLHERLWQSGASGLLRNEYEIDVGQAHAAMALRREHARESQLDQALPARRTPSITGLATTRPIANGPVTAGLSTAALRDSAQPLRQIEMRIVAGSSDGGGADGRFRIVAQLPHPGREVEVRHLPKIQGNT